jgi:hypothetical protein
MLSTMWYSLYDMSAKEAIMGKAMESLPIPLPLTEYLIDVNYII